MSIRKRSWTTKEGEQVAWVVDYKDQHGDRRLKTFKRKKDAESWSTTALFQVKQGTHTADSASITVAQAAEQWLERGEIADLDPQTLRTYRIHVEQHINPLIGSIKLSQLTTPGVKDFVNKLLKGWEADPAQPARTKATARKILTSLKGILKEAQAWGRVSQNVAQPVSIKIPSRHKGQIEIPSKEEIRAIIANAEGRWRPLLLTAIFSGLRASELRGLDWRDVDFEAGVIRVTQRADRWNAIGSPKSKAGRREIPMSPMLANTLKEWKLACPNGELNLVFPNGRGNVEALGNIYRRGFAPLQIKLGIVNEAGKAKYGLHALRHFCVSWLIEQGFPPKHIQTIVGHSGIQLTYDTYGHLFPSPEDDQARLRAGELSLLGQAD